MDLTRLTPYINNRISLSNLTYLRLCAVDLTGVPSLLVEKSQALALEDLEIDRCLNIAPFLQALTKVYARSPGKLSSAAVILLRVDQSSEETVQAVAQFLSSCPSLTNLEIDMYGCRLIDKALILRHYATLLSVSLYTSLSDNFRSYSTADLKLVLERCSNPQHLAINLPDPQLGHIDGLSDGFTLNGTDRNSARASTPLEQTIVRKSIPRIISHFTNCMVGYTRSAQFTTDTLCDEFTPYRLWP